MGRLADISIDVTALRTSAPFRRLFGAQLASGIGNEVTLVTLQLHMYAITGSSLNVGLLGLAQVVPGVVAALLGGAIADAIDRRKLLLLVQLAQLLVSGALAMLAFAPGHPALWSLYALAAASSALAGIDGPARTAVIPALVEAATLRSAVQLREVLTQSGRVVGPVLAGVLVATVDFGAAYALDALTFAFAFIMFWRLPALVPERRRRFELSSIVESFTFVRRNRVLAATFIADIVAMVVAMPRAVFPELADSVFGVGPAGASVLYAAPAAGAMVGLLFFGGITGRVRREGMAVLVAVALWGIAIALAGLSPWFWLAVGLIAAAGLADMVSAIFRQTMLLAIVPDELRGRMSAVHILVVTGGPKLGDARAGATADLLGVRASIVIGGAASAVGMLVLAAKVPAFARWVPSAAVAAAADGDPTTAPPPAGPGEPPAAPPPADLPGA